MSVETRTLNVYNEWVEVLEVSEPNLDYWNLGPRAGILWQITPNIGLEATYYHSLWTEVESPNTAPQWEISQFTLGIRVGG